MRDPGIYPEDTDSSVEWTDERLMLSVQAGDRDAFARLMKRYETPLFNYLRRMTGSSSDAEDLFQEAFIRVYRSSGRFRTSGVFRPWVFRIATNLCLDHLKRRARRGEISLDRAGPGNSPDSGRALHLKSKAPNPRESAIGREAVAKLETAISELSAKHRAVFLMARYDGLSYGEIARVLRIPTGTVKSRMNKTVKILMDRLQEEDHE